MLKQVPGAIWISSPKCQLFQTGCLAISCNLSKPCVHSCLIALKFDWPLDSTAAKAPFTQGCDLLPTFERPENWPGRSVVTQTQKVLFLCNAAPPLCVPWITKTAVEAQQVVQNGGRTIIMVAQGLPWSPNGGTVVATVIAQWTLLVRQRKHSGVTREAEASHKLVHNVYKYNCKNYFTGRPMTDPCASILQPRRCACLPPASFGRPVSDRPPWRPLCDCFEHAQNFTTTMTSMVRFGCPLCYPWTTKATFLPRLCLQRRPGQFYGRTREA